MQASSQRALRRGVVVEPGIFDGDAGGCRQCDGQGLVLGAEKSLPVFFFREVEVAEHHVPDPTGTPRKDCIGGWCAGNP